MSKEKILLVGAITHTFAQYPDGPRERYGGGVMYGGRAAVNLGMDVVALTVGTPDIETGIAELRSRGITVIRVPRDAGLVSCNDYTGEVRKLAVRSVVEDPIKPGEIDLNIYEISGMAVYPNYDKEISPELLEFFTGKTKILFDPSAYTRKLGPKNEKGLRPITQGHWENVNQFAGKVDILKLSNEDLSGIKFQRKDLSEGEKCQELVKNGFSLVVLTRGMNSTLIVDKNGVKEAPAFKITSVETAGAGEVFGIGFLKKYIETGDPLKAAIFGNACAAVHVSGQEVNMENVEKMIAQKKFS